jgi:general secretion pathway protein B
LIVSFILDALRKSESERQREAAPSLSRIPEAVAARRLPPWAVGTIALLGLGVIALAAALWLTARSPSNVSSAARNNPGTLPAVPATSSASSDESAALDARANPSLEPPATTSSEAAGGRAVETSARPSLEPSSSRGAELDETRSDHADDVVSAAKPDTDTEADAVTETDIATETDTATDTGRSAPALLPSYPTAAAADASLPKLNLEFHAFAADPARRFVYINGEKYVEGSQLERGLRILRITSDGVVIGAAGKELMLPRK